MNPWTSPPPELPIGDDEHAAHCREHHLPWCDTCKRPAVFSEFFGLRHSTAEHPYGSAVAEAAFDHEATTREWWTS